MSGVLVDTNVLLDILEDDPDWAFWSGRALALAASSGTLVMNPVVYAEVSVEFTTIEDVEHALPSYAWQREPIPFEAAFLAGKAYLEYKSRGGLRRSLLPDFLIGAHAAVARHTLLTRDGARYKTYFPTVKLIAPE